MKISVIIPTFKRKEILSKTIQAAVESVRNLDAEVIVVNDGPPYDHFEESESVLFYSNTKKGVSSARNYGFAKSSGEIIFFLDNDILLTEKAVRHFVELIAERPNSIFNPNWRYPDKLMDFMRTSQFGRFLISTGNYSYRAWATNVAWDSGPLIEVNELATFCLVMKRETFDQIGKFDEDIFFGEEDLELTRRAKKMGFDLVIDESIYVSHNESDRISLINKLNRMKIVGSMLSKNPEFTYSSIKKVILEIQAKLSFVLFLGIKMIPNLKAFDFAYSFFAHRLLANAIYQGYCVGSGNTSIAHTYSKLK